MSRGESGSTGVAARVPVADEIETDIIPGYDDTRLDAVLQRDVTLPDGWKTLVKRSLDPPRTGDDEA